MSYKKRNLEIYKQVAALLKGIQLKGDAGHDAIINTYVDRNDRPEPLGDELYIRSYIEGCPCTIEAWLLRAAQEIPEFGEALQMAAANHAKGLGIMPQQIKSIHKAQHN